MRVELIKSGSDEQKQVFSFQEKINRGDTAELATKKVARFFQEKNRGVTPSVAAPGVTHPSDATGYYSSSFASKTDSNRNSC